MADELPAGDLQKASENLARLHAFLAARAAWAVTADGAAQIPQMLGAVGELSSVVGGMLQDNGIAFPESAAASPEGLPPAELDADRLRQAGTFLEQLRQWFVARSDRTIGRAGRDAARNVHACLIGLSASLRSLGTPPPSQTGEATPVAPGELGGTAGSDDGPPLHPGASPHPVEGSTGAGEVRQAAVVAPPAGVGPTVRSDGARLELEDRVEEPLLITFRGALELSSNARDRIDRFLSENGIELSQGDRRRFYAKVVKWIENTPEGQMLVLKIGWRDGAPAPYSSFVPRPREAPEG